ncbi:amino acid adenylation domain-containing protein [Pseudomonas gingeri]|uniref:Amino acid adenylation domain-containing protein n=1 Tax=Pseudomonas gingeri TaxID=117681 RepID=A0A7Y8C566_9PSED|nr:amino acid adenylation domain-containing protein [Pseudomonas gingeri]NWB99514.1 amino acid adenylation domain-containing protein [Pseudomonas gingeri]
MRSDKSEQTDFVHFSQAPSVEGERSTGHQAFIRLERADAAGSASDANLLCAWLVSACWYANWTEEVSSVVISRTETFACPTVDPFEPTSKLRAECQKRLHDMRAIPSTSWLAQAWSNTELCQGLFGAAQLQMSVSEASVDLWFDTRILHRDLANEILDSICAIATALQTDEDITPQELVECARPAQSDSELLGKLQGVTDQDVWEALNGHILRSPEKAAICDAGITISYGQLSTLVRELVTQLERAGVTAGSRVALCMPRSNTFIIAALALLSLDAIYIPIDLELPAERRNLMMDDARVGWTIDRDAAVTKVRSGSEADSQGDSGCGYVLFTSGTTGRPKGVMVSRASLSYYASVARYTFNLTHHTRVLQFATVSFDASVEEIYPCLMAGGTVIIRDSSVDLRPSKFLEFVHEQQITFLDLPTGYWRELSLACLSESLRFPPSVQLVVIGGEALYKSDINSWFQLPSPRPELINSYGPTESTVVTAVQRVRSPDAMEEAKNDISIGRPIAGSRIILLDRFDKPAPLGGLGQICISSPGVAVGYLNSPEMTDEKFFARIENDRRQRRYYKSGDMGRISIDGALEYHGRIDNVVKRQGFRISLGEIESIVRTIPEVADCCVFMTETSSNGKLLCIVQLKPEVDVTPDSLRHQLSLDLPSYMVPNSFIRIDQIPRNIAGKIDYKKIQALASKASEPTCKNDDDYEPECELMAGLRSILGGRALNWSLSLTDNGADSLEIVRLAVFLERHTGQEWPTSTLYHYPNLQMILNDASQSNPMQRGGQTFSDWRYTELHRLRGLIRISATRSAPTEDGILVTGATGLLGRYVVKDLLKRTPRQVYCLVRNQTGETVESLHKKLTQTLNVNSVDRQRLHLLIGDLNFDNLGLEGETIQRLQSGISDIVHCAADTNMLSPYSRLLTTNVLGSVNLINLAFAANARFHFISSLALFDTEPSLPNLSPTTQIADLDNVESGYLQSKWMIEMLLEQLEAEGLRATTYRCGRLWGGTKSVGDASNDYVLQFLSVCQRLGLFPIIPMQLEVCPADRIASQIAISVTSPLSASSAVHNTYHLCSSKSHTMDEIYTAMRLQVHNLSLVSSANWLVALDSHVQAHPDDLPAMRVFAVVKSLSLSKCIDDLMMNDLVASSEWWEHGVAPGLTLEEIVRTVLNYSFCSSSQEQYVEAARRPTKQTH